MKFLCVDLYTHYLCLLVLRPFNSLLWLWCMTLDIVKKSAGRPAGGKLCQIVTTLLSEPMIHTHTVGGLPWDRLWSAIHWKSKRAAFQSRASSIRAQVLASKLPATTAPQATSRCGVVSCGAEALRVYKLTNLREQRDSRRPHYWPYCFVFYIVVPRLVKH